MKRFVWLAVLAAMTVAASEAMAGDPAGSPGPALSAPAVGPGIRRNIIGSPAGAAGLGNPQLRNPAALGNVPDPGQNGLVQTGIQPGGDATPAAAPAAVAGAVAVAEKPLTPAECLRITAMVIDHCLFDAAQQGVASPGFFPLIPLPAPPVGDMELAAVGLVSEAAGDLGPTFHVTFRNNSPVTARHFHVSLVAVAGSLSTASPVATVEVPETAAGATAQVDIQLPAGAMAMGPQGQAAPFDTLVAAVDSFDELAETDESNNVATLPRTEVVLVEAAPAAAPADDASPSQTDAVKPGDPAPDETPPVPAPEDGTGLDKIDLDKVDGAANLLTP